MRRRTFEEMITHFNQTVSEMDIDRKYKMTLLGMVTALLQRHDEDVAQIVRCKECVYADENYHCDYMTTWNDGDCFCCYGKRRTDEAD